MHLLRCFINNSSSLPLNKSKKWESFFYLFFSSYIALRGHTYLFNVHRLSIVKRRDCRRIFAFNWIPRTFTKSGMACPNVSHIWRVGDRRFHRRKCENASELIYSNFMLINSYVIYCSICVCWMIDRCMNAHHRCSSMLLH